MKRYDQMKNTQRKLYCFTLLLALVGCQTAPDKPAEMISALDEAIKESSKPKPKALQNVPNDIQQELMQRSISQARQGLLAEKRLEIAASDVQGNLQVDVYSHGAELESSEETRPIPVWSAPPGVHVPQTRDRCD